MKNNNKPVEPPQWILERSSVTIKTVEKTESNPKPKRKSKKDK